MKYQEEPQHITLVKADLMESLKFYRFMKACISIYKLYQFLSYRYFSQLEFKDDVKSLRLNIEDLKNRGSNIDVSLIFSFLLILEKNYSKAFQILNGLRENQSKSSLQIDLLYLLLSELPDSVNSLRIEDLKKIKDLQRFPSKYYDYQIYFCSLRNSHKTKEIYRLETLLSLKELARRNQDLDLEFSIAYDLVLIGEYSNSLIYFEKSFFECGNIFSLIRACGLCLNMRNFEKLYFLAQIGLTHPTFACSFHFYLGCYFFDKEKDPKKALRYLIYPGYFIDYMDQHFFKLKEVFKQNLNKHRSRLNELICKFPFNLSWLDHKNYSNVSNTVSNIRVLIESDYKNYCKYIYVLENLNDQFKLKEFLSKYKTDSRKINSEFYLFLSLSFIYIEDHESFEYYLKKFISRSLNDSMIKVKEVRRMNSNNSKLLEKDLFDSLSDGMYGSYEDFGGDLDDLDEMEGRG